MNNNNDFEDHAYYHLDNDLHDDIPPDIKMNSSSDDDITMIYDTISIPESNVSSQLIDIYEKNNNKYGEFIEIKFKNSLVPSRLLNLTSLTELVFKKCQIGELVYLPPNLEKITCINSKLKIVSCKEYPPSLNYINFSNNNIELIIDIPENITHLYLDYNNLSYINNLPENLHVLSIKNNIIRNIDFLNNNIKELYLNSNQIDKINILSDSLEHLDISKNTVIEITYLPPNLKTFIAYNCKIQNIECELPKKLQKIDLYNNYLEYIQDFPDSLIWVDLSYNNLKILPGNISRLKYFDISSNTDLIYDCNCDNWKIFMKQKETNDKFIMDIPDNICKDESSSEDESSEDDSSSQDDSSEDENSDNNSNYLKDIINNFNNSDSINSVNSNILYEDGNCDDSIDNNMIVDIKVQEVSDTSNTCNTNMIINKDDTLDEEFQDNKSNLNDQIQNILNNININNTINNTINNINTNIIRHVKLSKIYCI